MTLNKFQGKYKVRCGKILDIEWNEEKQRSENIRETIFYDNNGEAKHINKIICYPSLDIMDSIHPGENL